MSRRYTPPGHHRSVEAFGEHLRSLDPAFDCADELLGPEGPLAKPLTVFRREAGNRFAIHPMEGWDGNRDGSPSDLTRRRWRRFGLSGAKLIWGGEAVAVLPEGRANPNQLFIDGNRLGDCVAWLGILRREILAGHEESGIGGERPVIGLQLTHSGRLSRPDPPPALPRPMRAQVHPVLDGRLRRAAERPLIGDDQLEEVAGAYVRAARCAERAGYDFVDIKCCHGYLLHELLGAHTRPGPYGGSFENRVRLPLRIIAAVRAECPELGIGVRLSVGDVAPFAAAGDGIGVPEIDAPKPADLGFGLNPSDVSVPEPTCAEAIRYIGLAVEAGVEVVNVTMGSPYSCPHLSRPFTYPASDSYLPPEDPLRSVLRQLAAVRTVRAAFPRLPLVGTGYSYLQEWLPYVAEAEVGAGHVDFVGLGRMVLAYPRLPADVLAGRPLERRRICRTFSDCTTGPRNNMVSGCYPLDERYRRSPEFARIKEIKKAAAL
ncbi:MAG: NADH:flavin oxidoreductase [Holophagales bacterium]|nr:NADH:flavin oxidoreductase [Holophagales bacterium]MYG29764.1 NADH:flavin oxidoreductase [Holophagales bacterium]MYI79178.1 NADH:flavin oxidoreductase [Holophagales bacterium]